MTVPLRLLSGRLLVRNVALNLVATGLPLAAAVVAIPLLVDGYGTERFGLLAIIWMGIGYFSLFDLGLGRALTKLVAERLGRGETKDLAVLTRTGLRLMLLLGILATLAVAMSSSWFVHEVFNVSPLLQKEAVWSFAILGATLPFVVTSAGLVGILQAHQRFGAITAVRLPLGLINFVGPLVALAFTPSLIAGTAVLASARAIAFVAYWLLYRPTGDVNRQKRAQSAASLREMLTFGGWITVSNVVGPVMVYFDRFFIGALLTLTAVTYYTTPYEVVTRLWVIPDALGGVVFPALATAMVADTARARMIFSTSARATLLIMFPLISAVVLFAPEGLTLWLGDVFAKESGPVLRWLAIGVFINSMARLPFQVLQGHGRPDLTAKIHLAELPFYVAALWIGITTFGIVGAAAVWTTRVLLDSVLLFVIGAREVPDLASLHLRTLAIAMAGTVGLAALTVPQSGVLKIILVVTVLGVAGVLAGRSYVAARRTMHEVAQVAL